MRMVRIKKSVIDYNDHAGRLMAPCTIGVCAIRSLIHRLFFFTIVSDSIALFQNLEKHKVDFKSRYLVLR